MKKRHNKFIYATAVIILIIACFKLESDRKPHFKVIRGNYIQTDNIVKENKKVNINYASIEDLDKLKGIGPTIAERIVEYRQKKPFLSINEIMNVKGIGKNKFEDIKDYITIEEN
ncbi:MAG: ComEA family DNA-binding protein [Clostridia bacterium]|nr:ComEA family DNA-binding protein [Clostridia bacterium]